MIFSIYVCYKTCFMTIFKALYQAEVPYIFYSRYIYVTSGWSRILKFSMKEDVIAHGKEKIRKLTIYKSMMIGCVLNQSWLKPVFFLFCFFRKDPTRWIFSMFYQCFLGQSFDIFPVFLVMVLEFLSDFANFCRFSFCFFVRMA